MIMALRAALAFSCPLAVSLLPVTARAQGVELKPGIMSAHPLLGHDADGFWHGGPVLTLSFPTKAGAPTSDVLFGFGYEIASPSWLWHQAAVETDLEAVSFGLGSAAVSPLLPLAPHGPSMLGLGLGLSGLFESRDGERSAGVRLQLMFFLGGVVGLGNNVDWFPGAGDSIRHALMLRLSI